MARPLLSSRLLAACLALAAASPARGAWQPAARASTGFSLIDYGGSPPGVALDLELEGVLRPVPELELGVEAAVSVPLPTGEETTPTDLLLRANPIVGLRFGDDRRWMYVRAGFGVDGHVNDGEFEPVAVVTGSIGFVVAPSTLLFAFGFEAAGKLKVAGDLPTQSVGLGGFVEFEF